MNVSLSPLWGHQQNNLNNFACESVNQNHLFFFNQSFKLKENFTLSKKQVYLIWKSDFRSPVFWKENPDLVKRITCFVETPCIVPAMLFLLGWVSARARFLKTTSQLPLTKLTSTKKLNQ
uniref:Uncharacterized protein n=1 Tax=Cacopsylla melanoneura TaxID=428564 RepID=A0A8D8VQG9_9HEMI